MKVQMLLVTTLLSGCASMLGVPDAASVAQAAKDSPNGTVVCSTWAGGKIVAISLDKGTGPRNGAVTVGDGCNVTFSNGVAK